MIMLLWENMVRNPILMYISHDDDDLISWFPAMTRHFIVRSYFVVPQMELKFLLFSENMAGVSYPEW